ncbi:GNAT family N-acetyltransferase [Angustibacter speluncae]
MLVRPARDDELDQAGRLVAQAYRDGDPTGTPDPYLEVVADARARSRDGEVLVAVDDDGTLLGSVTFALPPSPLAELGRDDEGEFRMLGVTASAQGRGVGAALVRACLDRSRAAGKAGVVLCTQEWMRSAQRLYERQGFVRDPDRDWQPVPGVQLLAYRLRFDAAPPAPEH